MLGLKKNTPLTPAQQAMFDEHREYAGRIGRAYWARSFRHLPEEDIEANAMLGLWKACLTWTPGKSPQTMWVMYGVRHAILDMVIKESRWFGYRTGGAGRNGKPPAKNRRVDGRPSMCSPPARIGLSVGGFSSKEIVRGRHENAEDSPRDRMQSDEEFERLVGLAATEEDREILRLVFRDGLLRREAGEKIGKSTPRTIQLLTAAVRMIRSKVDEKGETLPQYQDAA